MTDHDFFGLEREQRISKSGVREVFTPHKPIHSVKFFFGRQAQVQKLIEQINTPGQHALLYGDRGVGKSSLANVAAQLLLANLIKGTLFQKRCDSNTTFEEIVAGPLREAGVHPDLEKVTTSHKRGGRAGLRIPLADAGIDSSRETTETYRGTPITLSASEVSERLGPLRGLLLIDEADAIPKPEDRKKLAELIKLLSDSGSDFKLLVVGIADTGEQLTGGHPSVQRCLKETKLKRMSSAELGQIIEEGAKKLKLTFEPPAVESIVKLSAGYPHFTHLLALKCAENAIADKKRTITKSDLAHVMKQAVEDAEGSLTRSYDSAVRSYGTDMYRKILLGAAGINSPEFTAGELRDSIQQVTGDPITQYSLNNYLNRLISDGYDTILRRVAKGVYCFNDPRMPSFIKIANGYLR